MLNPRLVHSIPGRARFALTSFKLYPELWGMVLAQMARTPGILQVNMSECTGRVLIHFDPAEMTLPDVIRNMEALAEDFTDDRTVWKQEVAATFETTLAKPSPLLNTIHDQYSAIHGRQHGKQANDIPVSLILSAGGFAFFSLKHLLIGRSAFAAKPILFYGSGALAAVTGYAFLHRGFERICKTHRWNTATVLNAAALTFSLLRENLVVLASLSLMHWLNWKCKQYDLNVAQNADVAQNAVGKKLADVTQDTDVSKEIIQYAEMESRWGMCLAAVAWLISGNPLYGLGILLAANPRPAVIPAQYAWKQANLVAKEKGYVLPRNGSLAKLARTGSVLFADTSLMFTERAEIHCITRGDEQEVWDAAATALYNYEHPWKEIVMAKAGHTHSNLHVSRRSSHSDGGVAVETDGRTIFFGNTAYFKKQHVHCHAYLLEVKRWNKAGYPTVLIGRQMKNGKAECIGVLVEFNKGITPEFQIVSDMARKHHWSIGVVNNSLALDNEILVHHRVDSKWMQAECIRFDIRSEKKNSELLVIGKEDLQLPEWMQDIPSIDVAQIHRLERSCRIAKGIDKVVQENFLIVKIWNWTGSMLAVPLSIIGATVANTIADSLSLLFMIRARRVCERLAV